MSRRIPSRVFIPPTNPPHLNPCSLQPSLWAPSGGPWLNRSASPPSQNLLRWEAQRAKPTYPPPWRLPFWAPCMLPRALDNQYSLAPPGFVLVAQYGLGCFPVRLWMLSLRHLQNSTSLTRRKISPISHSTSFLVPHRSRLCHRSPQVRRLYLHTHCSGQILQSLQVSFPPGFTYSSQNSRGPLP